MRYCLIFLFLFMSIFCFAQNEQIEVANQNESNKSIINNFVENEKDLWHTKTPLLEIPTEDKTIINDTETKNHLDNFIKNLQVSQEPITNPFNYENFLYLLGCFIVLCGIIYFSTKYLRKN